MTNVGKIEFFTDLDAWKEGHVLVLGIYRLTTSFPKEEIYGIVSQLRRASVSITSSIAEGFGRFSFKEKAQFYLIAKGSLTELQNQLIVAKDVGYLNEKEFQNIFLQTVKVHKIINGLIKSTKGRI